MSEREVFSEQEATDIIRAAVQLQERLKSGEDYTPGLTREELMRMAAEMGLSEEAMRQAIATRGQIQPEDRRGFWTQQFSRVIDRELKPEDFDIVGTTVSRSGTHSNGLKQLGRTISGAVSRGMGYGMLEVTSRKGRTRIDVKSGSFVCFMATLYPGLLFGVLGALILSLTVNPIVGGLVGLGLVALGVVGLNLTLPIAHRRMKELADELKRRIEEELPEEPSRPSQPIE